MNDTSVRRYRGVRCLFCNQPIELPAIISRLEEENDNENSDDATIPFGARVFALRCGICEKEYPYSADEIIEVEGAPRGRLAHAAHAS